MKQLNALLKVTVSAIRHRLAHGKNDARTLDALGQLIHYRLTWKKHDLEFLPDEILPPVFRSAKDAAALIPDGATVISTGIAGNSRCSIFFWAVRESFEKNGKPKNLTWITVGGSGGRGRAPGTVEELGLPGLVTRHIAGHLETHKSLLKLGQEGRIELHCLSQGVMSKLIAGQGEGKKELKTKVGLGTYLDPATGGGSNVISNSQSNLVRSDGGELVYTLPDINVALFSAPYADKSGNIYFKNAATITENREAAAAAKANGGLVMAVVSGFIEADPGSISIPADKVDAIVVNPRNEQTGGVLQQKFLPMFTEGAKTDIIAAYNLVKLANTVIGITPIRDSIDNAVARMAASLFVKATKPGALVNIGVGLPEEVSHILFETGLYKELTFSTESGVYGGMPVSGMYFGASINPQKLISSAEMFRLYEKELDIAVLGYLEVDSEGNVNVSRRGPKVTDYVGPGGFSDIVSSAKTVIFVGKWSEGGAYSIKDGKLETEKPGKPKFVEKVREITFNGKIALNKGVNVYYVSTVGMFKLTVKGLELISVMPGVDVKRDITGFSKAEINIPQGGDVPVVSREIVTGKGFELHF